MSPQVFKTVSEFRLACNEVRAKGQTLGLVPTLGALHRAHQALMQTASEQADVLAVTIFVNPTQFGPGEDYERYPRDLSRDIALCEEMGAQLIFAPPREEMYRASASTRVRVDSLCEGLCGRNRPGHFEGVATVVTKLLAVTGPCTAVFGRKDYQQLRVIRRLVEDLLLPVEVVEQPIVREADGLALSSRNQYLSAEERNRALAIPRALAAAAACFEQGERESERLFSVARASLQSAGLTSEYLELVNTDTLSPILGAVVAEQTGLFVAVRLGGTRLIDNLIFGSDPSPLLGVQRAEAVR